MSFSCKFCSTKVRTIYGNPMAGEYRREYKCDRCGATPQVCDGCGDVVYEYSVTAFEDLKRPNSPFRREVFICSTCDPEDEIPAGAQHRHTRQVDGTPDSQ